MNIRRIAGLPLVHFVAIGLALFALRGLESLAVRRPPIDDTSPSGLQARRTEAVDRVSERALRGEALDDEVLFREGLWRGLDRADPVVRTRLVRDYRFAFPDAGESAQALRAARALGLERSDPVVRRRIIDVMRRSLASSTRGAPPSQGEIERYYAEHREQLRDPARFRIRQLLLKGASGADPRTVGSGGRSEARPGGRAFPLAASSGLATESELAREFGAAFAKRVARLEPGRWSEPIPSVYGLHRVRVDERRDARLLPLSQVRGRIQSRLREARSQDRSRRALRRLREAWGVPRASAARGEP